MKLSLSDDAFPHIVATVVTAAMMLLMGRLLLWALDDRPVETEDESLRVIFIERMRGSSGIALQPRAPAQSRAAPTTAAAESRSVRQPEKAPTQAPSSLIGKLYTRGGRIRLPAGVSIDPLRSTARPPGVPDERARRLVERPNRIDQRQTRFDKDWASSGTLGDLAAQKLGRRLEGLEGLGKLVFGEDQPARARPPPQVRFNPALHERPSDLGSEVTGDAYKAAPIAFEKAPDLKGEASRRIRAKLGGLEKRYAACDQGRLRRLLAPVRSHLADLERTEYAMAHGADPLQAEHLLPGIADTAYDQARRAMWYAEHQLGGPCGSRHR